MKLKTLFASLAVSALFFSSCEQPIEPTYLDAIQVSKSYVSISTEGGSTTITLTATQDWNVSFIGVNYGTNDQAEVDWLTVSPMSGTATTDKPAELTFSADADESGKECQVYIDCGGVQQIINVIQGLPQPSIATVADVLNGIEGKLYQVTGTVTAITSTQYGNFYLNDGTGELYIYGTVNESGSYDWESFNIDVGDEVTVQGNRKDYNGTIEFEDALFISVNKSLIAIDSVDPEDAALPLEGGTLAVTLNCKGDGIGVEVPEDAKDWLTIASIGGTTANPVVTFQAAYNNLGDRSTTVTFTTTDDEGKVYSAQQTLTQKGSIIEATAAEINAAPDGETMYRYTGYLREVASDLYGNLYVTDYTGEVYVYGVLDENGESKQWATMGINAGDIITVVGPKTSYNGNPQLKDVTVEDHKAVTDATLSEFIAAGVAEDVWYRLTGTVDNIYNTEYGNFHLLDDAGNDVVVYGLVAGWGGPSKEFASLGIQEGDVITIVGVRDEFNGTIQVGDAFFVSKESGSGDEPAGNVEVLSFSELYPEIDGEAFNLENGVTYTWGGLTVTSVSVGNTSNRIWANDHSLRVYGGGSITFNAGDKVITKVEFDTKKGHFAEASVGTLTEDVWTGEASEVTFTAEEQVQVLSITVTYKD